jgi:transcription initiation factor TFIIIB Brf1 subunit/transcription initiation factor TFIIB
MSSATTARVALERVSQYDGDPRTCEWCGDNDAEVVTQGEAICRDCHTVGYERALLQELAVISAERDAARAEVERLREAGNALSFAAQTDGGTSGRDDELCDAILRWSALSTKGGA